MNTNIKFYISNSAANLANKLAEFTSTATVEAEFGDTVVEGTAETLAHHGPRSGNPAPGLRASNPIQELEAIGLSHIDLDTLGGCMSLLGKPMVHSFWKWAAYVDVHGPHKLYSQPTDLPNIADVDALNGFWAWSQNHRYFPPRDGSVEDASQYITEAMDIIDKLLGGDPTLLDEGRVFAEKNKHLNEKSVVERIEDVILRKSPVFVNHLYCMPGDTIPCAGVVSLKEGTGEITLSLADPVPGVSCRDIAVALWGSEAGGHAGIAGGPRTGGFNLEDARDAAIMLSIAVAAAQKPA